ncbi:hypothetical protein SODALDRAFT_283088 [Sodiomyces alkalinus F11]|uniref:2'-phosphotransferase n=1 Tax=Sodiomyces alkalinus (strain CBS 110278 / VKM F-3762 / F11) TaxID=1314773 RepID=A0A3N2PN11_SODAK|nr:hypothetical protein SODALDRAFT_283088 [Sodiomyces alkalinus F11]ROT35726.1 hypothetical protein SODALDRAFT_283088 [Sodiomyces alkalinus F11]
MGRSGKGAGGHRGGRGGKGGSGRPQNRNVLVSKALSRLLRHQADNAGIKLDAGGWAPLDKVLAHGPIRSLKVTVEDIVNVITTSDKTRFAMKTANPSASSPSSSPAPPSEDSTATSMRMPDPSADPADWLIRANQGHSIKTVDSAALLRPITLEEGNIPPSVFHGTYLAVWPAIEASGGLKRMGRNHVHFATALPEDAAREVSGMRRDSELLVYVDIEASLREGGISWWISENGVVLTEGDAEGFVPCRFFKEVVPRVAGVPVLWQDGVKVGEIPAGVKGRVPPGSRGGGRGGGGGRGKGRGRGRA